jgi:hypothetical protein
MKLQLTLTSLLLTLMLSLAAFAVIAAPAYANGDDHDHDHGLEVAMDNAAEIAQMKALIALLTQLLEVMQKQASMGAAMSDKAHDHSEHDHSSHGHEHSSDDELAITVETHADETHVHIYVGGEETDSFFIEADISDEEAVYDAIVAETDLDRDDVVAAAEFATDEHEDDHDDDEMDLDGIHIMGDGTVMLGDGTVVDDATVNDEGMIVLSDGTEVEPEFDLR